MNDENKGTLNTLVKGAGMTAAGIFASKFLAYLYRTAVARMAGKEAYGQLSLGIAVIGMGTTITFMSLDQGIEKFVSEYRMEDDKAKIRGVVLSSLFISLLMSLIVGGGIYFYAEFIAAQIFKSQGLASILRVFAFVPPFAAISKVFISVAVGFKDVKYEVISERVAKNVIQVAATVGLLATGLGVIGAVYGWLISSIVTAGITVFLVERYVFPVLRPKFEAKYNFSELLKFSFPLFLTGMIGTLLGWADTFFLGYYMGDAEVGLYNAALPIAMMLQIPYRSFNSLSLPSMNEIKDSTEDTSRTLKTLTRWTIISTIPLFALLFLFAEPSIALLFGREYVSASGVLVILSAGYFFSVSTGHLGAVIKSESRNEFILFNTVANFFLNIALNILLIPRYGITGAAIATAGSIFFVNSLMLMETYHIKKVQPFSRRQLKPIVAVVPSILVVYLVLNQLFTTVPVFALVPGFIFFGALYLALFLAMGLEEEDREMIKAVGDKFGCREEAEKLLEKVP